jgi:hypothetical protein
MLLNLSNHPSTVWSAEQMHAAIEQFERVKDMPFPNIDPHATSEEVEQLAYQYARTLHSQYIHGLTTLHIMGEMTFTYALLKELKNSFDCVASTTERSVLEEADGRKTVQFKFVQFRRYC